MDEFSSIKEALNFALKNIIVAPSTKSDLKSVVTYLIEAIEKLGYNTTAISKIKRKDVRKMLDYLQINKDLSNNRYNKIRAYTRMLFEELNQIEVMDNNPINGIKKKKETKKIKSILSTEERNKINESVNITLSEY
ncbi:hypothetical protein [Aquimarina sp. RZ0]|uniref:hypothetical protein n=1 Tax=Aquimarina sp. RZ0 TaxID=2607730 RepID=UPI0011F297BD|nr:hypothetical protein [Aquimarina sp. RZ0]KAA1243080.1 hypothetical protein F0000_22765 [Aquimarina sp. RZ0]